MYVYGDGWITYFNIIIHRCRNNISISASIRITGLFLCRRRSGGWWEAKSGVYSVHCVGHMSRVSRVTRLCHAATGTSATDSSQVGGARGMRGRGPGSWGHKHLSRQVWCSLVIVRDRYNSLEVNVTGVELLWIAPAVVTTDHHGARTQLIRVPLLRCCYLVCRNKSRQWDSVRY